MCVCACVCVCVRARVCVGTCVACAEICEQIEHYLCTHQFRRQCPASPLALVPMLLRVPACGQHLSFLETNAWSDSRTPEFGEALGCEFTGANSLGVASAGV